MNQISRTKNPLIHNGTSQYERLLQALTPDFFKIDNRSAKELINATYQYAHLLKYYNLENKPDGDWTDFWKVEMLTFLAHLSTIDVEQIVFDYNHIKETFEQGTAEEIETTEDNRREAYHVQLIEYLLQLALRLEDTLENLPTDLSLRTEIITLIEKDSITDTEQLADALRRLIGFHKEAHKRLFGTRLASTDYLPLFKTYWGIPNQQYFDNEVDFSPAYLENDQAELDKILKEFYQTFKKIKARANYYFDRNLDTPQLRQPHVALFLTFLRLFDYARNSLNKLTQKHLEFYYEQVLCLREGAAVPDDAHLILELAATVDQTLIEAGTEFIAGQDQNGRPIIFQTLENWFLNKAQVADVKTVYLDVNGVFKDSDGQPTKRIHAANDVSLVYKDQIEQPNEKALFWRSMGDNPDLPDGEIGFAIASPQLILREGRRVVDIMIETSRAILDENNDPISNLFVFATLNQKNYFNVRLSSTEEWQQLSFEPEMSLDDSNDDLETFINPSYNYNVKLLTSADNNSTQAKYLFTFRVVLEKDHLPVDNLGEELAGAFGIDSQWPILYLSLQPAPELDELTAELYMNLRALSFNKIEIKVDVKDIQENLIIQSDQGVFDGTQKFFPFGPVPEIGDKFYIGSTEVFQKALDTLKVSFDWIARNDLGIFENYYKEYTDYLNNLGNGKQIQDPFVQIEFIDRAQISIPKQLVRFGERSDDKIITGLVRDIRNNPVPSVRIELLYIDPNAPADPPIVINNKTTGVAGSELGRYSIIVPSKVRINDNTDEVDPFPTDDEVGNGERDLDIDEKNISIRFIPPAEDYENSIEDKPLQALEEFAESQIVAPTPIKIELFSNINVVLFPKSVRYGVFLYNNNNNPDFNVLGSFSGLVSDVNDSPLSGIEVNITDSDGTAPRSTDSNGSLEENYLFDELSFIPDKIDFALTNPILQLKDTEVNDHTVINVRLIPSEEIQPIEDDSAIFNSVSGEIQNVFGREDLDLVKVQIETTYTLDAATEDRRITIRTNPLSSGQYRLQVDPNFPSKITYFGNKFSKDLVEIEPLSLSVEEATSPVINAKLYVPSRVEKFLTKSNLLVVEVKDILDNDLMDVKFSDDVETAVLSTNNGKYLLSGFTNGFNIGSISKDGFKSIENINFEGFNHLVIRLLPTSNFIVEELASPGDQLTWRIIDVAGKPITTENLIINNSEQQFVTDANGIISGVVEDSNGNYNFELEGFESVTVSLDESTVSRLVQVILQWSVEENSETITTNVQGTVFTGGGSPQESVTVIAKGTVSIAEEIAQIEYETTTDPNGNYFIPIIENDITINEITFINKKFHKTVSNVNAIENIVLNQQVQKQRNFDGTISGNVFDINGKKLEKVRVSANDMNDFVLTEENGFYSLNLPSNSLPAELSFEDERYEPITVSIKENHFYSVNVRMFPKKIFRIIEGQVTDVFGSNLGQVEIAVQIEKTNSDGSIKVISTNVQAKTVSEDAKYRIEIPDGLDNTAYLLYSLPGFRNVKIPLDDNIQVEFPTELEVILTRSVINVVMYFDSINLINLINENRFLTENLDVNINNLNLNRDIRTQEFIRYDPTLKRGFIQLSLENEDFLHKIYPNVLVDSTVKLAGSDNDSPPIELPNPPYTPATNAIKLSYSSIQQIYPIPENEQPGEKIDEFFYLYSFNGYEQAPIKQRVDQPIKLLPQYNKPTFPNESANQLANGNLFIALENLNPGSNLSLLFQIQEGSEAEPDVDAPEIHWAYLAKDNEWKPLPISNVLKDTTNGLKRTGLVQIATPRDMVNETTLFDGGYHWLRIAISEVNMEGELALAVGLPSIVDIKAQAILVQFEDNENALDHLAQPLPVGTISQLRVSQSAVSSIDQPFPSFNGRLPEAGNQFYVRVSERLRHKDRAITIYDYERLLLERFPKIQRAKCLKNTVPGFYNVIDDSRTADVELVPGSVTIAVIPSLESRAGIAAVEPRFSKGDLEAMEDFLRTKTNLFVAEAQKGLHVVNPLYEPVRLEFKVEFKRGEDDNARKLDLDQAIKGFLAPWLFDSQSDIRFERSLNRSRIILFIEQQSYVEAIKDFEMFHCDIKVIGNEIIPMTSRSVLTTNIKEGKGPDDTDHDIHDVEDICLDPDQNA